MAKLNFHVVLVLQIKKDELKKGRQYSRLIDETALVCSSWGWSGGARKFYTSSEPGTPQKWVHDGLLRKKRGKQKMAPVQLLTGLPYSLFWEDHRHFAKTQTSSCLSLCLCGLCGSARWPGHRSGDILTHSVNSNSTLCDLSTWSILSHSPTLTSLSSSPSL